VAKVPTQKVLSNRIIPTEVDKLYRQAMENVSGTRCYYKSCILCDWMYIVFCVFCIVLRLQLCMSPDKRSATPVVLNREKSLSFKSHSCHESMTGTSLN
jgi:hypothetical protein